MRLWEGFHHDKKTPILITVDYDEELDLILVEVTRGYDKDSVTFTPKHLPEDGLMHISDVEKSVKASNNLIKELRRRK